MAVALIGLFFLCVHVNAFLMKTGSLTIRGRDRTLYMAFLNKRDNTPLRWDIAKEHIKYVREHGVEQFLRQYKKTWRTKTPRFVWGDEIEVGIFKKDEKSGHFDLSNRAHEMREELNSEPRPVVNEIEWCEYQPEYGAWMIESVPSRPYSGTTAELLEVERNMKIRRNRLTAKLEDNEIAPYISNFPMLGVDGYPHTEGRGGEIAASQYTSDGIINPHPRFGTLTQNIRMRRGENVDIKRMTADGMEEVILLPQIFFSFNITISPLFLTS